MWLLVCIPSGPGQEGVKKGAGDLPSVVSTEPCTSEEAYHDQAGKIIQILWQIVDLAKPNR